MLDNLMKWLIISSFFVLSACGTTSTVKFETKDKASVSVMTWDQLDREVKEIGVTPIEIPIEEIKGKIVKIAAPGKTPQFWVFSEIAGQKFEAQLALTDLPKDTMTVTGGGGSVDINETHRLLMKSYQALVSGDLTAATSLAKNLTEIEPRLAAPLIIIGLAAMQSGNKQEAMLSFNKAKALDPKDMEITKLIEVVK